MQHSKPIRAAIGYNLPAVKKKKKGKKKLGTLIVHTSNLLFPISNGLQVIREGDEDQELYIFCLIGLKLFANSCFDVIYTHFVQTVLALQAKKTCFST